MVVVLLKKNILEAKQKYIAHQCNCLTTTGKGLSKEIFKKYPFANIYCQRKYRTPGNIIICSSDSDKKIIINILGQNFPGKSKFESDSVEKRLKWFEKCLDEIGNLGIDEIAMPYKIGCGLAGGDWSKYLKLIENFGEKYKINVFLHRI